MEILNPDLVKFLKSNVADSSLICYKQAWMWRTGPKSIDISINRNYNIHIERSSGNHFTCYPRQNAERICIFEYMMAYISESGERIYLV